MKRDWLSNIRKSKQLTQHDVASKSFIDRSFYSHIEIGKRNPSISVAKNIAAVLDFDPMSFFKDDYSSSSPEHTRFKHDIFELLNNMENGHILYLYNNFDSYLHHVVIFSLIGAWKNSSCFVIDTPSNFSQIKKCLEKSLLDTEINNYIHHINKEKIMIQSPESLSHTPLKDLLAQLEGEDSIFLWCHVRRDHPNDWIFELQNQLDSRDFMVNNKKIITIHSYDASIVSAHTNIELMRKVPYLMTDNEIVDSPLYHSSKKTTLYPSLFMQEDM